MAKNKEKQTVKPEMSLQEINISSPGGNIESYLNCLKRSIDQLDVDSINQTLNVLSEAYMEEKNIFIMGNGGSASTASHYVCDFNKGISEGRSKKFKMISTLSRIILSVNIIFTWKATFYYVYIIFFYCSFYFGP